MCQLQKGFFEIGIILLVNWRKERVREEVHGSSSSGLLFYPDRKPLPWRLLHRPDIQEEHLQVLYYTGESEMSICVLVFKEEIKTLPYQVPRVCNRDLGFTNDCLDKLHNCVCFGLGSSFSPVRTRGSKTLEDLAALISSPTPSCRRPSTSRSN